MELGHEGHPPLVKVRHLIEDQNESTKDSEHYELLQASPPQTSTIQLKSLQLEVQSATHTSEKAFVCGFPGCPASYSRKDHLKRHTENTHESRRLEFRCSECPRKYANSSSLRLHVKTKHSNGASRYNIEIKNAILKLLNKISFLSIRQKNAVLTNFILS